MRELQYSEFEVMHVYDPKSPVTPYFKKILTTPEGVLLAFLSVAYFAGFVFFDALVSIIARFGESLDEDYRTAFLLMPLLLLVIFLRMDISVKTKGDRLLTALLMLITACVPVLHILGFF